MLKEYMIMEILGCPAYEGIKDKKWLMKQPKQEIKQAYDQVQDYIDGCGDFS